MSFLFKPPSMPPMPQMEIPKVEDVPSLEDQARQQKAEEDLLRRTKNRKGRRSTILTEPELEDDQATTKQPSLLGG